MEHKHKSVLFKKLHKDAQLPTRAHEDLEIGDTGYDLFSVEEKVIYPGQSAIIDVGLQLAYISPGWWLQIQPKSGLGFKHCIYPHPGVIDNQYRGGLGVKLYNISPTQSVDFKPYTVKVGDKIAQLVLKKLHSIDVIEWSDEIHNTERGEGGFGSTGK